MENIHINDGNNRKSGEIEKFELGSVAIFEDI